jgi:hypothetical protein
MSNSGGFVGTLKTTPRGNPLYQYTLLDPPKQVKYGMG